MSKACCNMLYCTFQRCVHKLYAITLTMIGEVKNRTASIFCLWYVCHRQQVLPATLALRVSRNAHECLSTCPQVEPLVQREKFLSRYYRRRARRLACSNQTVSLPSSCDVDTDLLSVCSEYTSYMPSRRIPPTALFSFLLFGLYLHFQNTFFF